MSERQVYFRNRLIFIQKKHFNVSFQKNCDFALKKKRKERPSRITYISQHFKMLLCNT